MLNMTFGEFTENSASTHFVNKGKRRARKSRDTKLRVSPSSFSRYGFRTEKFLETTLLARAA
jgi:hypothetical protein